MVPLHLKPPSRHYQANIYHAFGFFNTAVEIHDIMLRDKSKKRAVLMDNQQVLLAARLCMFGM